MTNLLDLPYEVRAQILGYVVSYVVPAPTEETIRDSIYAPQLGHRRCTIFLPDSLSLDCSLSVYLLNEQINREARAAAATPLGVQYYLDLVVFGKGELMVPTWTHISRPSNFVDVLTCTIRRPQRAFESRSLEISNFDHGYSDVPPTIWDLFQLMNHFFDHGRYLRPVSGSSSSRHCIKKLIVDVQTPMLEEGTQWWPPTTSLRQVRYALRDTRYRLRADELLKFLINVVHHLVDFDYDTGICAEAIYTHIGHIEFRHDGHITTVIDLDAQLDSFQSQLEAHGNVSTLTAGSCQLRIYSTLQLWLPLIKRLRADLGISSSAPKGHGDRVRGWDAKNYQSWEDCQKTVRHEQLETS